MININFIESKEISLCNNIQCKLIKKTVFFKLSVFVFLYLMFLYGTVPYFALDFDLWLVRD